MTVLDKGKRLGVIVQGVQSGFLRVAQSVGLENKIMKENIALVKNIPPACVIASVGIVGDIRGGVAVSFTPDALVSAVKAMSCGMMTGDIEDPMTASCIGELANMVAGGIAIFAGEQKVNIDVTPPQVFSGEKISQSYPASINWFSVPYLLVPSGIVHFNVFVSD